MWPVCESEWINNELKPLNVHKQQWQSAVSACGPAHIEWTRYSTQTLRNTTKSQSLSASDACLNRISLLFVPCMTAALHSCGLHRAQWTQSRVRTVRRTRGLVGSYIYVVVHNWNQYRWVCGSSSWQQWPLSAPTVPCPGHSVMRSWKLPENFPPHTHTLTNSPSSPRASSSSSSSSLVTCVIMDGEGSIGSVALTAPRCFFVCCLLALMCRSQFPAVRARLTTCMSPRPLPVCKHAFWARRTAPSESEKS